MEYKKLEALAGKFVGLNFTSETIIECKSETDRLLLLGLPTSFACNLKCKFCFTDTHNNEGQALSFDQRIKIVDESIKLGVKTVVMGAPGEPFCDNDFFNIVEAVRSRNLDLVIFTNLIKVTFETAQFLKSNRVGVFGSCHSLDKSKYEHMVGVRNTFEKMMQGAQNLLDAGYSSFDFAICMVVNELNKAEMSETIEFWKGKGIKVYLEYCNITGMAENSIQELFLPYKEFLSLKNNLPEVERGFNPLSPLVTSSGKCFTGEYAIIVGADGTITRCYDPGPKGVLGNISNMTLKEAIQLKNDNPCFCPGYDFCPGRNLFQKKK